MKTVTSLSDIVDNHEFIENPLDAYETYTYNIEWFVVDKNADREFQAMEAYNVETIINDGWPEPNINKVIIAKTGVTTEFVLTDLNIESVGTGNATYSKIAGTAVFLDFNITQVGETNLVDNLQNSIAICGYDTLQTATFYIKINFVGFDNNGKKVKMPQTKVFPFWIKDFAGLQTQTDTKGTTTALSGTIVPDKVVMDDVLSKTEDYFRYDIKDTLSETLQEFIEKLNQSNENAHLNLQPNLQNTYKVTLSKRFKEWAGGSSIKDEKSSQTSWTGGEGETIPHELTQVGQVMPRTNIYGVLEEICQNAIAVNVEQTKSKPDYTKVLKITPWLIPKKDGYNPIQGRNAYDIEYYIDYELKSVTHNLIDQWAKARRAKYMIQKLFNDERVNKKYNYLFTGKNDQILEFNITLENELAKIYTTPSDYWALEHMLQQGTYENDKLWEGYIKRIEDAQKEQKEADGIYQDLKAKLESLVEKDKEEGILIRNQLLDAVATTMGEDVAQQLETMSTAELLHYVSLEDDMKDYWQEAAKFKDQLLSRAEMIEKALAASENPMSWNKSYQTAKRKATDTLLSDAHATYLSENAKERYKSHQELFDKLAKKSTKGMILTEELDNDAISKLSNEEYQTILKSQQNNPIEFRRVIYHTLEKQSNDTIKSTLNQEQVEQAKLKYYESKTNNISMIEAQMTIKGDPYWLEGFLSPSLAKKTFGDLGTIKDNKGLNLKATINGTSGLVLVSGVSAGTDLYDNVLKRNMITSVYFVTSINSSFSGGTFTQALTMIKNTEAEVFGVDEGPRIFGPSLPELGDKNGLGMEGIDAAIDQHQSYKSGEGLPSWFDIGRKLTAEQIVKNIDAVEAGKTRIEENYVDQYFLELNNGGEGELITTAPKNWIDKNTEKIIDAQNTTTDHTITAQSGMVGHFNPTGDAITRNVLANQTLNQLPLLHKICESQQKNLVKPFNSCDTIKETDKKMLESFGLTIEDQGKASTVTAMNTQINDWIANDGIMFSDEEIAVYQIAAGGELNITDHDPDDVQKLVKKATFERTPEIILEEQILGMPSEIVSGSHQNHAIANNGILDGSKPLNAEIIEATAINTTIIEPYQHADGSIKTDEDFEAEYEAIQADTTCVGACRTTKILKLTNVQNDAWIAQAKLDKINEAKVKEIVDESCPAGTESKMNIKKRKFECAPILPGKLTDRELNDVEVLKVAANKTLEENYYSESGIAEGMAWKANAVELIETELNDKNLVISDNDKNQLKLGVANKINNIVALNELSDNDYRTIQGYETGIKTIIATAQDGHRGDLTTAVNVGLNEDELAILNEQRAETITNLSKFNWTTDGRRVFEDELDSIDVDIAKNTLRQFDEHMTAVATICSGSTCEYVPIYNPTKKDDHTTAIIKNADEQFDVVLAGVDNTYAGVTTQNNLDQLTQAKNMYYELTSTASGNMTTVEDDWGLVIEVKDFSNIGDNGDGTYSIEYIDANGVTQTIPDPSTYFDIHTTSYSDIVPAYKQDYKLLREKVADLFPNIEVISNIDLNGIALTLSTLKDGTGMILLNGTAFIINPNP